MPRHGTTSQVIAVGRSQPFNPAEFIDQDWSIWRGPVDGNGLEGDEDQDARSLLLTEVDLSKVIFETTLKRREDSVRGEERLLRLKATGHIRLDAKVFQFLWENKQLIPEHWEQMPYITFDGTILRSPLGSRDVLYLYFYDGERHWRYDWLGYDFDAVYRSALLAS